MLSCFLTSLRNNLFFLILKINIEKGRTSRALEFQTVDIENYISAKTLSVYYKNQGLGNEVNKMHDIEKLHGHTYFAILLV